MERRQCIAYSTDFGLVGPRSGDHTDPTVYGISTDKGATTGCPKVGSGGLCIKIGVSSHGGCGKFIYF